jgi:hypothetical protein
MASNNSKTGLQPIIIYFERFILYQIENKPVCRAARYNLNHFNLFLGTNNHNKERTALPDACYNTTIA